MDAEGRRRMNARAMRNVRIPPTPERFEWFCRNFSALRDAALARGEPWPADLEEWSEALERSTDVERA